MSLRLRLFLLLGTLVALLVVGQWWLVRTLSRDVSTEVGEVAFSVGRSVITAVGGEVQEVEGEPRELVAEHIKVRLDPSDAPGREAPSTLHLAPTLKLSPGEGPGEAAAASNVYSFRLGPGGRSEVEVEAGAGGEGGDATVIRTVVLSLGEHADEKVLVVEGGEGASTIPVPRGGLEERLDRFARRLQLASVGLLGLGLLAAAVVAHRISTPLARLSAAARRVGSGELGAQAPVPREREVGAAVEAFNHMSSRLQRLDSDARALRGREHLAELGEVARGLAHSLRNPLNALGLSVEELASRAAGAGEPGSAEPAELAAAARRQIQRIDTAVRSLLVLAAEGAGGATAEAVEVAGLAEDVALEALQDARGRVHIRVEAAGGGEGAPTVLTAVAAELRAVIQALVVNAAEASPDGGTVRLRVAPVAGPEGEGAEGLAGPGGVRVEVEDDGPGVAPAVRPRLFSPHVTTKPGGSGMGLYLAQRIAASRYGGSLALEDRPAGGTRAVVTLFPRRESPSGGEATHA